MCFSAPASFVAGTALVATGAASRKVARKDERLIAAIPFLFGVQQLFEGAQWFALSRGARSAPAAYGFLFFAFLVWPIYVPYVLLRVDAPRRRLHLAFLALGISVALQLLVAVLKDGVVVEEVSRHIRYDVIVPFREMTIALYVLATCGPFLFASKEEFRLFGALLFLSYAVSAFFFTSAFTSVWCFFAAVLSLLVYAYLARQKA